jgi:predicted ATPase
VATLSRQNPVLMIFEDAHWIDPTTLELFGRIVDKIPSLHALLIMTFRPEFEPPWIGQSYVTALTISRLTDREAGAMFDRIVGNKHLPLSMRRDIIERTDGISLFVDEMTKAVLEAESEIAAENTVAAAPSPVAPVPASLHASLMARLDRLGAAKEVAQIGAASGREFSHSLLAAVLRTRESELLPALHHLVQAGLLFRQGVPPQATYLFKHALVQDAAYGTLLREPRRAGGLCTFHVWRERTRNSAKSTTLGAASAKRRRRLRKQRKSGGKLRSIASLAKSPFCRASQIKLKRKSILNVRSWSRERSNRNLGNSAPP